MKRQYKVLLIILVLNIVNAFMLTSCWNYREADNLTLARGFAVDMTEEGKFFISVETADMHKAGTEGQGKSAIIESEGETMFDAVRNAVLLNVPRLYWGHSTAVFISQQIAEEGVMKIMDFLTRDAETRLDAHPVIYKGETAREIFEAKPLTAELVSEELREMLHAHENTSKTLHIRIFQFIERLENEGVSAVMPAVCLTEIKGEKTLKLCGTAVFKKDKLVGFLDEDDTKYFSFVIDEVKGGLLVVNIGSEDEGGKVSLEILKSNTKLKAKYKENKISIEIKIKVRTAMNEIEVMDFPINEKEIENIEMAAEEQLKKDIENLIKKVQDINSDIFGFGRTVKRQLPKVWKEKGKDWDNIFKELEVEIVPEIEIVHSALLKKTINMGD